MSNRPRCSPVGLGGIGPGFESRNKLIDIDMLDIDMDVTMSKGCKGDGQHDKTPGMNANFMVLRTG